MHDRVFKIMETVIGFSSVSVHTPPLYVFIHTLILALTHTPAGDSRLRKKEDRFLISLWEEREREVKDGVDDIPEDQHCQEWQRQNHAGS